MELRLLDKFLESYSKDFFDKNYNTDTSKLRFSLASKCKDADDRAMLEFALLQLDAYRKYRSKLQSFLKDDFSFLFPSMLAAEQSSNYLVSRYHAEVVKSLPGFPFTCFMDITAGLGIDFMTIISMCDFNPINCTAIDMDPLKAAILKYNLSRSSFKEAKVVCDDSLKYLYALETEHNLSNAGDLINTSAGRLIFADPARRSDSNDRLYDPEECLPDIVGNIDLLKKYADTILIKYSPMLDLHRLDSIFKDIRNIHIVCVKNECKEVLVEISKDNDFREIKVINIGDTIESFNIPYNEWKSTDYNLPYFSDRIYDTSICNGLYLYEPNAGVMKTGAWGYLCVKFPNLQKADTNTHLFLSSDYYSDFPGRVSKIDSIIDKKNKKELKGNKINIVCRNYPATPDKIARELQLKSSPDNSRFLYSFRLNGKPIQLITRLANR